jgi:uncharacterized protein (DUF305 family)
MRMPSSTGNEAPVTTGVSPASDDDLAVDRLAADVDDLHDADHDDLLDPDGGGTGRRTPRFGTVALAAAIVIGLLLGFAAGWLAPRLTTPGDSSPEAGFARDMINHHAQAVAMGLIAFQRAETPAVRQLGVDLATAQQGEIGAMHTWLRQWRLEPTGSQPPMEWMPEPSTLSRDGLMPGMATDAEMRQLREARGKALDILFLQLMIRHHLGGVHMIDAILTLTDDPEVVQVARTMKNTQQTELNNLHAELAALGGTTLPAN